jgi:hypothetical protein
MTQPAPEPCKLMTLHVGTADCLERDCDEYATEDGQPTDIERCSHIHLADYCETHSTLNEEFELEYYDPAEPWPCRYDATRTGVPAEAAR